MKIALICLFLVQMLDGVGTHITIRAFKSADIEQNPIMRYVIKSYGMTGMYMFKFLLFLVFAVGLGCYVYPIKPTSALCTTWFGVGFYLCICLVHASTIYKLQFIDANDVQNYMRLWKS